MKGLEALGVECLVAARQQGIVEELLQCIGDADRTPFREFLGMLVSTHVVHARRRLEEMELVERMLTELGMEPLMTRATIHSHGRTDAADIMPADGKVPPLPEVIDILADGVVKPTPR